MSDFSLDILDLDFQGLPGAIAAHLLRGPGGAALVETGPGSTVPALVRRLAALGLEPADVSDVLVTHIHLDHAGAAGWWAGQGARVHVHHVGAPHLADPSRLLASAQRIYGERMHDLWGDFLPVPQENLRVLQDGDVVEAAGLRLTALDTPGHARHHMVYRLDDLAFTGDVAGIRLTPDAYMRLPTPPPEFDRQAWLDSLQRLSGLGLRRLYLTHFGPVDEPVPHWQETARLVDEYAGRAQDGLRRGLGREAILAELRAWDEARLAGQSLDDLARARYRSVGPMDMSVDGLLRYWSKQP